MSGDETKIALMEKDITQIKNDVSAIKKQLDNGLSRYMGIISNDVDWLKRFFWLLMMVSVSGFASGLFAVLWRR